MYVILLKSETSETFAFVAVFTKVTNNYQNDL